MAKTEPGTAPATSPDYKAGYERGYQDGLNEEIEVSDDFDSGHREGHSLGFREGQEQAFGEFYRLLFEMEPIPGKGTMAALLYAHHKLIHSALRAIE